MAQEQPLQPTEVIVEVFDINELKSIVKDEYAKNYSTVSKMDSDSANRMLDALTEMVISNHLYEEANEIDLITRVRGDNSYAMSLIRKAYDKRYGELVTIDNTLADSKITGSSGSDITNYSPYKSIDENGLFPGYVNQISKEIKPVQTEVLGEKVDKFREYTVSIGIDINASPASSQVSNVDSVLLVDYSNSMSNNLDNAKSAAKKLIDSVFPKNYNLNDPNTAKMAVIVFSDHSTLVCELTNDREKLINAIDGIGISTRSDSGADGTNIQEAILYAKSYLKINDENSSVSGERKQNLIVFSDGAVTTRKTDIWNTDNNSMFGQANSDTKRWSNLNPRDWQNDLVAEKISVIGENFVAVEEEIGNDSVFKKQIEFSNKITALEAQFAVFQGLDIYTLDYSDNSASENLMKNLTDKLGTKPDLSSDIKNSPLGSGNSSNNGNKYFKSINATKMIDEILTAYNKKVHNSFDGFEINEQLRKEFELDKNSIIVSEKPFGEEVIGKWGDVSSDKDYLKLKTPKDFQEGIYYLTYTLKAKQDEKIFPDGADKELYGEKALDKQNFAEVSELSFTVVNGQKKNLPFEDLKISVQPNLQIEFTAVEDAILLGEQGKTLPVIKTGTGLYKYDIKENYKDKNMVSFKKEDKFIPEKPIDAEIEDVNFEYESDGVYNYIMEVTDIISGQTQSKDISINVVDPVIKLNIVDQNGNTSMEGVFETKLTAKDIENNTQVFYLSGLGNRSFSYKNGSQALKRGSEFSVSAYVPFGYKVVGVSDSDGASDGNVKIDLVKSADGKLSGYSHEIYVKIQKNNDTKFFFDWTWIFKGGSGSMPKNN